ncbi:MAG: MoaD/ThiS family protein [Rhodospirillales bacterium]|jgi:molybdopterin converting factor small subunit|nr:MoaD/ThiS family protein [Rhodospirillales bacterium]|tara:strand:- start:54 stop:347 length:294 start_codon:yes stop_codon:yes gene_type:complete
MSKRIKQLVTEFFGPAREITGVAEVELDLETTASARDLLRALAASYPALKGPIIDPEGWSTAPYILMNLDGRETIQNYDLELQPGARVLLMSALAGG